LELHECRGIGGVEAPRMSCNGILACRGALVVKRGGGDNSSTAVVIAQYRKAAFGLSSPSKLGWQRSLINAVPCSMGC